MKLLRNFFYILTIIAIIVYVYFQRDDLASLAQMTAIEITLLIGISILATIINALMFREIVSFFKINLPAWELYALTIANTMYNYLLPARGGIAIRALYLKRNFNLPFSKYVSLTTAISMVGLYCASLIALLLSLYLWMRNQLTDTIFLQISIVLHIGVILFVFALAKISYIKLEKKGRLVDFINNTIQGLDHFKTNKIRLFRVALLYIVFTFLTSFKLFIVFQVMDVDVNFLKLVFINSLVIFSIFFSITPGNLGINESIYGLSASILGINFNQAIIGAVLDRAISILVIMVIGLIASKSLLKKI